MTKPITCESLQVGDKLVRYYRATGWCAARVMWVNRDMHTAGLEVMIDPPLGWATVYSSLESPARLRWPTPEELLTLEWPA